MSLDKMLSLAEISFPEKPIRKEERQDGACFIYQDALVDVRIDREDDLARYHLKITNPSRSPRKLEVAFDTPLQLAYLPHLVHIPPVYDRKQTLGFAHFGLPSRVGLPREAAPSDAPLLILFDPGSNQPAVLISCETLEKGVGMVLSPEAVSLTFLDGTERPSFEIELVAVAGKNLLDAIERYEQAVPYRGIQREDAKMMWFIDTGTYLESGGLERFAEEAKEAARLGAKYLVVECGHRGTMFGNEYWSPQNADSIEEIRLYSGILDTCKEVGILPLMYYNICHGIKGLMEEKPHGHPELMDLTYDDAEDWAQQNVFEEVHPVDVNWYQEGRPKPHYPFDSSPEMELRNPQWRAWIRDRIRFMLEQYPLLAGTYIDVWPGTLPYFGKSKADHERDYGDQEWWNAMDGFMWEIRQATKAFPDKVLLINDTRMTNKAQESGDLLLSEDYGDRGDPAEAFWQCLKARISNHDSKPMYLFHHWKSLHNPIKTRLFLASACPLRLAYCIYDSGRSAPEYEEYHRAIEEMSWALQEEATLEEISISESTRNIERLAYRTPNRRVKVDFPKAKVEASKA